MITSIDLVAKVAAILESQNWTVEIEKNEKGILLDICARDPGGSRVIIECKAYTRLVGLRTVREFASAVNFIREEKPQERAWLVTTSGFTSNAQSALKRFQIDGITIDELIQRFKTRPETLAERQDAWKKKAAKARKTQKRIFVVMPFSEEMLDVYILGIRWAASELGLVADRADDLEHGREIISEIRKAISEYDVVLADTSGANPNVCYEVGYAHALDRPTILICRKGEKLPFDLQGTNHLMYENIVGLREPLREKLRTTLGLFGT